jgi:sugar/nucleoside kinase (ribokinase family)
MDIPEGDLDLLAIGETLIDLISTEQAEEGLRYATSFGRYLGGSPANIAVNVARLGCQAAVISKTGIGAFGRFLKGELRYHGVNTDYIIWPDHQEARQVVEDVYRYATITKPSLDDAQRLFGPGHSPQAYIAAIHALGPQTVILTMGREGALISHEGRVLGHVPARQIDVVDVTGAGDAFWAGFLVALLDGYSLERCALFAREIVELKLTTVGPLPGSIDRGEIYARLSESSMNGASNGVKVDISLP